MRLKIVTPLSVIIDEDITNLRAEDASGSFGILDGHAPFLTALTISIVSWKKSEKAHYCAVRGGILTVASGDFTTIAIATREAIIGDDLSKLDAQVLAQFAEQADAERVDHAETVQLQLNAIRRMVSSLQSGADTGAFR